MADSVDVSFGANADELLSALDSIAESLKALEQSLTGLSAGMNTTLEGMTQKVSSSSGQSTQILREATKEWQTLFNPLDRAFSQSVSGIIRGTETLKQAEQKAVQSIVVSYVDAAEKMVTKAIVSQLAQSTAASAGATQRKAIASGENTDFLGLIRNQLSQWLGLEEAKTAATDAGNADRTASNTAAATAASASDSAATKSSVVKHAASAAAAVYDDVAQIPLVGWVLAPPAAAAAFAGVMAFDSLIPSFDVGAWDLPSDMVAKVHQGESVIPASIAGPMRDFFNGGGSGSSGSQPVNVVFQVQAMDGPSVQAFFNKNAKQLAGSVSRYMADNPSSRGNY
jgi:hypothetical protein